MVNLGDRVRDMVTRMEGIATSRTEWLNGCIRVGIEYLSGDKKNPEVRRETFDEEQLEVLVENAVIPMSKREGKRKPAWGMPRTGGGGRPDPARQIDPR